MRWTAAQLLAHEFFRPLLKGNESSEEGSAEDDDATPAVPSVPAGAHLGGSSGVPLVTPLSQIGGQHGQQLHRSLTPRSLAARLREETQNQQLTSQATFGSKSILDAGGLHVQQQAP